MAVPEPLREFVEDARGSLATAHSVNVGIAAGNAEAQLRSAMGYVVLTPFLREAFDDAIGRIADFHEEVVDQNTLTVRVTPAIENARNVALVAIERLAEALSDAKPNADARAIGLDWC